MQAAGINTVGDLAAADPAVVKQILQDAQNADLRRVGNASWQQQAQNIVGDPPSGPNAFSNLGRFNSVTDIMSYGGSIAHTLGWEPGAMVADWGEGLGTIGGVGQVMYNWTPAVEFFTQGPVVKTTSRFGKFFGPLAILTGGFSVAGGLSELAETRQDGHWGADSTAALMDTIAGATAVAGGIALLIPGAQPVAGVLFGVSAISSGVSVVAENWSAIQSFFTPPSTPYSGAQSVTPPPAAVAPSPTPSVPTPTGTPTFSSSSTPTNTPTGTPSSTPTPPTTQTPTPTPQTTQTPEPPNSTNP